MEYSKVANKILTEALKVAKRHKSEFIQPIHILVAFSTLNPRRFSAEFAPYGKSIEGLLNGTETNAAFNEIISEEVNAYLCAMRTDEEAWAIAVSLSDQLLDGLDSASTKVVTKGSEQPVDLALSQKSAQIFNDQLLHDIAIVAAMTPDEASRLVAQDAILLTKQILDLSGAGKESRRHVEGLLGRQIHEEADPISLSPLLQRLMAQETQSASSLAVKIAEGYLDIGTRAAQLDGVITPDEVREIDSFKRLLRGNLGNAITAKSTSRLRFEDHFSDLIGLESVKDELAKYFEFGQLANVRRSQGIQVSNGTSHMAFLGSPGAGKTEVARRYGAAMKDAGLLRTGHVLEVDRGDLVAKYVGQTEVKTLDVLTRSLGGVLFIDEAYSLADHYGDDQKGFGEEAIDTIVRFMENHRDDFTLIIAGYQEPIESLLNLNEGLRSRIANVIEFPEYSDFELLEIFKIYVRKNSLVTSEAVNMAVSRLIRVSRGQHGFGGARGVRNIFEAMCRNQAKRIAHFGSFLTMEDLMTLESSDVPEIENDSRGPSRIGYL